MGNLYNQLSAGWDHGRPFAAVPGGQGMSYADLEPRTAAYANVLRELGVMRGDRVVVQAEKCLELVMLYLGCLRAGALFLPLNTAYTVGELEYSLRDAEPALLVCDTGKRETAEELAHRLGVERVEDLSAIAGGSISARADLASTSFATLDMSGAEPAAILYTSGTTGRPKGAVLSHGNLASNAWTLCRGWRFTSSDILIHALPIFHAHGLFVAINVTLAAGASLFFLPRFDIDEVYRALPAATVMMGVPTFYIRMLGDARFDRQAMSTLRLFISGSAPLSADVHREFAERTGHVILERYGMTETNMICSNPYEGDRVAGSVGLPLDGVSVRIADAETGDVFP